MKPTRAIRNAAADALAAQAATLAPATDANKMALIMAPFEPGESLTFADLTLATFDGATPILCGTGTQPTAYDPSTDDSVIDIKPPAGGFRWETTGTTNLPQTIYGYCLLDNAAAVLYAAAAFDVPVILTGINQRVDGLDAQITLRTNSMF